MIHVYHMKFTAPQDFLRDIVLEFLENEFSQDMNIVPFETDGFKTFSFIDQEKQKNGDAG